MDTTHYSTFVVMVTVKMIVNKRNNVDYRIETWNHGHQRALNKQVETGRVYLSARSLGGRSGEDHTRAVQEDAQTHRHKDTHFLKRHVVQSQNFTAEVPTLFRPDPHMNSVRDYWVSSVLPKVTST